MAADPESRPLYFANGDFAKTVADIIASPRRGKAYTSQDALYEISDRQREYYTRCFRHLLKNTQGTTNLEGVLNGGDPRVVDFFKRSGLDNESLSRFFKDTHLAEFSDTPPLLVDSRPTAVKQTIPLLALKSPCGPPPQPPPRPQLRGHTRSASLDMMKNIQLAQTGMPLSYGDRRPSDSTTVTADHSSGLTISGSIPTAPPPPVPQRVSPPAPIPRRSSTAETQTEGRYLDANDIERYIAEFDTQIADLLGDEADATAGKGVERWARRCEGLRAQNAELEAERARMAQVRIQLELRLQEIEEGSCKGHKPTSL
ncbi:hypothetical protein OSTOST_07781 [Ostertagia ostertagi]